jgi:hypothetical protein
VEGIPDRDFYYLIGLRIRNSDSVVQHSLWADAAEDEAKIYFQFLNILKTIDKPSLIHYGAFETEFLKQMGVRYGISIQTALEDNGNYAEDCQAAELVAHALLQLLPTLGTAADRTVESGLDDVKTGG